MTKIVSFKATSKEVLLAAINENNNAELTFFEVDLSAPAATAAGAAFNTSVTVLSNMDGGYYGNVAVEYDRIDLAKMTTDNELLVMGPVYNHDDVVGLFNAAAGTGLIASELTSTFIDSSGTLTLTAKDGYLFKPGTKIKVRDEFDEWLDRAWLFTNYTLVDSAR